MINNDYGRVAFLIESSEVELNSNAIDIYQNEALQLGMKLIVHLKC